MRLRRWFRNLKPSVQTFVLSGLIFIFLICYIPLSKYIKPAIVSSLSLPLKFCEDISFNAKKFLRFQDLVEENSRLKKSIGQLKAQLIQLQEASLENKRLRGLLSLSQKEPYKTVCAFLVGKDSSNWTNTILIDKGSSSGIKIDMPVVSEGNLVGKVVEVYPNSSKVVLIVDFNSKVAAKIMRTRQDGIVFGTYEAGSHVCKIKYIQDIKIGDQVITSGQAGIYPKGLLIGEIEAVGQDKSGLYKLGKISLTVEFSSLEEVMVIID